MNILPRNIHASIHRFFFLPSDAMTLGICRCLFFSMLFCEYGRFNFAAYGNFPLSFRNPIWLFQAFHIPFISARSMGMLGGIFKLGLLFMALGWWTRTAGWLSAIVGSYVIAVPNNFGRAGHGDDVVVILLWVFAFARSGDGFSLDRFIAFKRGMPRRARSAEYTWPIRMVWLLMALVYLAAGVSKLRISGLHWALSDNMAFTLRAHEVNNSNPWLHLGVAIARHAWLVRSLAMATMLLETFFFLALFSRWARILIVPAMFCGHVFIAMVMGVVFTQFMFTYLFWLPWERVLRHAGAKRTRAAPD